MFPISLQFLNGSDIVLFSSGLVRQAKFCLHVVRWFFSGISRFHPTLRLTWLKMSEIILTGHKTQIKKEEVLFMILFDHTLTAVLEALVLMFQKLHTVRCRRK